MAEYIKITCDCGKKLRAPASNAGGKGKCPNCGGEFVIPKAPARTFLARHLYPLIAIAGFLVVGCVVLALIFLPQPKESNISDVGLSNHTESNPETVEIPQPQHKQEIDPLPQINPPPQIDPEIIQAIIAGIRENEDEHKAMFMRQKARQKIKFTEWRISWEEEYALEQTALTKKETEQRKAKYLERKKELSEKIEEARAKVEACGEKIAQIDAEIESTLATVKYEKDKYTDIEIPRIDCEHNDKVFAEIDRLRDKKKAPSKELLRLEDNLKSLERKRENDETYEDYENTRDDNKLKDIIRNKEAAIVSLQSEIEKLQSIMDKPHLLAAYVALTDAEKLIYSRRWEEITEEDIEPDVYAFLLGEEGFYLVRITATGPMNVYGTWRKATAQIKYKWNVDDGVLVFVEMVQSSAEWCKDD